VFSSEALPLAERYAELLATEGVLRGLIGPREAPRLWERHLMNCALVGQAIAGDAGQASGETLLDTSSRVDVCDIGSGAGLPGLVLAIARPGWDVTLVEPLLRRSTFLTEVVDELGLSNVTVLRARAEELHGTAEFSFVTSRAVAPLARLLGWSMPLVRRGGALVAMKGSSAGGEVTDAQKELRKYGAGEVRVEEYGVGLIDPPTTVVRVEATKLSRLGWDAQQRAHSSRSAPSSRRKGRRT
jgi:16S rRNA (guanine527-N7)-methyltransferase